MTIYTTAVVSAATIFDLETETSNLIITKTGGLNGTAGQTVVAGTEDYSKVAVIGKMVSGSGCAINLAEV